MPASDPSRQRDPRGAQILTPTALNKHIRQRIVDLQNLRVRGEVSQPRLSNGNLYFTLKDQGSKLPVTIWRTQLQKLNIKLRDGDEVICRGSVDHYVPTGRLSFIVWHVQTAGVGDLWRRFQQLKERLQKEGLFARDRKVPLPFLPRTVGIVTSPTGAAIQDMLRILGDRMATRVIVAPAKVQGYGADQQLARAIAALDASGLCDVIICGRGGGSIEDLWAFNEEVTVRAFAACKTPIVSAVGHETDTLLTDYVADRRAPTPTAAAELVVPKRAELLQRISENRRRILGRLQQRLQVRRRELHHQVARLGRGETLVSPARQHHEELRNRLILGQKAALDRRRRRQQHTHERLRAAHPRARLSQRRKALRLLRQRLVQVGPVTTRAQHRRLLNAKATLKALNPRAALARGYAIVRGPDGKALKNADEASVGMKVAIVLSSGSVSADVTEVRPESE